MSAQKIWQSFPCTFKELNLKVLLTCGQSFRWTNSEKDSDVWIGVLDNKLWLLRQTTTGFIEYQTLCEKQIKKENEQQFLKDYFQMHINVTKLYNNWSKNDVVFKNLQTPFHGIRILRQDPVENLFSFICSQNNNIVRITQLVEKLCTNYGSLVVEFEGKKYFTFPDVDALSKPEVEQELRQLGFGYRAKFIQRTAETITKKPNGWLMDLRTKPYEEAHASLCSLYGVGPKVADCVCLMSLDKHNAIPVDTHMWQIASREYLPHLKKMKTITDKAYNEIGDFFRDQFGGYAGWAQSVLFSSDLKKFEELKQEVSQEPTTEKKTTKANKRKKEVKSRKTKKKRN